MPAEEPALSDWQPPLQATQPPAYGIPPLQNILRLLPDVPRNSC